jgi:hypothetical protein
VYPRGRHEATVVLKRFRIADGKLLETDRANGQVHVYVVRGAHEE